MLAGLSLSEIDEIARSAAQIASFIRRGEDAAERFHTARCAIVIELSTDASSVASSVRRRDLVSAGLRAIDAEHKAWARTWGYNGGQQRAMPAFWRYWHAESSPNGSPEGHVVEKVALAQIWARLSLQHQEALYALSACEDYQQAAALLGVDFELFRGRIRHARSRFLTLWHEGEMPSQVWRRSDPGRRVDACSNGHELAGENLGWVGRPGRRKRVCRSCARDSTRRWRQRRDGLLTEGGDTSP